ncbi:carboxypeptidase-like regulatory domain-containing protein, partial [Singulisphaera rosea]
DPVFPATSAVITVTPAAPCLAITTQPPSSVVATTGFSMTVTVKDANGNLVPNYSGLVTLALATNPGNGTLSGTLTVQAVNGVATFTGLSLNKVAGGYLIQATASGLASAMSSAITVTSVATQLVFTYQPNVVYGGFGLAVTALDANGKVDLTYSGPVTLSLAANPGNGMLGGTLTVQAVHGVANFGNLSLNKLGDSYLIKATAPGLTSATSTAIDMVLPSDRLAFTTQPPSTVKIGVAFSLTVSAKDAGGFIDPNYSGIVTIGLAENPGHGMLSGTLSVKAVKGVAIFTNLTLNKPGVAYLIKVTAQSQIMSISSAITATTA